MYRLAFVSQHGVCVANPVYETLSKCQSVLDNYVEGCELDLPRHFCERDADGKLFVVPCNNEFVIIIEPVFDQE